MQEFFLNAFQLSNKWEYKAEVEIPSFKYTPPLTVLQQSVKLLLLTDTADHMLESDINILALASWG